MVQTLQHQAIKWYNIYVFRDTKHVEMENLLYDWQEIDQSYNLFT